jgi:hypothetical protein
MSTNFFPNEESLNYVRSVISQAGETLHAPLKEIGKHGIPETAAAAVGGAAGGGVGISMVAASGSVAGLSAAGITSGLGALGAIVGGGMVAGIMVAAAPVAILAVGAYAGVSYWNSQGLKQIKDALLKEALEKQSAIIEQLKSKANLAADRIGALEKLNTLLQEVIRDLELDLGLSRTTA